MIYQTISNGNSIQLNQHLQFIKEQELIQVHIDKFGPFKVSELLENNPLCFKYKFYQQEDQLGKVVEYKVGQNVNVMWLGQQKGSYHVEIGYR